MDIPSGPNGILRRSLTHALGPKGDSPLVLGHCIRLHSGLVAAKLSWESEDNIPLPNIPEIYKKYNDWVTSLFLLIVDCFWICFHQHLAPKPPLPTRKVCPDEPFGVLLQ